MPLTQHFGNLKIAKVFIIGHDPRLQKNDTQAGVCFFADYYFKPVPLKGSERAKYGLAKALFSYISDLTSRKYSPCDCYVTNLCNFPLPHADKGKTVLIPDRIAKESVAEFKNLLAQGDFKLIFPMSQQVNYLLQKSGFYSSSQKYLDDSEPKEIGIEKGYYEPKGKSPFLQICGNQYQAGGVPLFPILHVKQYPPKGAMARNYGPAYQKIIEAIKGLK